MMATPRTSKVTLQVFFAGFLRSGSAVAAIGLLLVFAIGGSVWGFVFSPVTGWDSGTLLAEAQAIDTQIHMADLQYNDPGYERQRLISPRSNLDSIAIVTGPEDSSLPISTPAEPTAVSSTDVAADDGTNSTSTPAEAGDGDSGSDDSAENATSTPSQDDGKISVEEALDILSN